MASALNNLIKTIYTTSLGSKVLSTGSRATTGNCNYETKMKAVN